MFFDACTLSNFATIDRLDVLESMYGYRAHWTETVQYEIRRGVPVEAKLQQVLDASWLGDPVEVSPPIRRMNEIDQIRRGLGGTSDKPLMHLGEAELIWFLENEATGAIFVTDDRPAFDFAARRGLIVMDSHKILQESYSYGNLGCPEAFDLLVEMATAGRGVRVPPSHAHIC